MNNPRSLPREHKGRVGDKCVNDWSIRRPKRERLAVCRRKEVNILSCRNRRCRFHGYSKKNSRSLRCVRMNASKEQLFCSLAFLAPRVGQTMGVLSPFISILCHSDWLFHRESCPRLDVVQRQAVGELRWVSNSAFSISPPVKSGTWTAISLLLRKVFNKYGAVVYIFLRW